MNKFQILVLTISVQDPGGAVKPGRAGDGGGGGEGAAGPGPPPRPGPAANTQASNILIDGNCQRRTTHRQPTMYMFAGSRLGLEPGLPTSNLDTNR